MGTLMLRRSLALARLGFALVWGYAPGLAGYGSASLFPTLAASAYLQDGLLNCVLMSKCRLMYCYMPPQRPTPVSGRGIGGHRPPMLSPIGSGG